MGGIFGLAAVTQLAQFLDEGGDVIRIDEFAVAWCGLALFGVARCGAAGYLAGWGVVLVFVVGEGIGYGGGGIVSVGEVALRACSVVDGAEG